MPQARLLALALAAFLPLGCGGTSASRTTTGPASGGGVLPTFSGVGSASALSPTEILVSWPDAIGGASNSSATMKYRVYRALDALSVQLSSALVHETKAGVTTFVDTGLPPFSTLYYRVEALDARGNLATSVRVTAARTPSVFAPGTIDYNTEVRPLWDTADPGGQTCIGCHDGVNPLGGRFDLSSPEGVLAGVGTLQNPDSFVVPYDGDATWNEFVYRFVGRPVEHGGYFTTPGAIVAMRDPLSGWVYEGALTAPDATPPIFQFDAIENAGKYHGRFVDHQTAEVTFFHAADPESLPLSGLTKGQLEYHVYAGEDSASIDWENPVATVFSPERTPQDDTITVVFPWTASHLCMVVRAMDASGRSVVLPPLNDPGYRAALALRWRNMAVNEREILLAR